MGSPFLYFIDDRLSLAELMAARLDGDVVVLGDAYIPADAVETRALRAGSLTGLLGDTLAATHLTAAWVHGVLSEPPSPHTVQRAVPRRLHHVPSRHLVYRDLAVDPADLVSIGGIRVTTPVRTLEDLCRVGDDAHTRADEARTRFHARNARLAREQAERVARVAARKEALAQTTASLTAASAGGTLDAAPARPEPTDTAATPAIPKTMDKAAVLAAIARGKARKTAAPRPTPPAAGPEDET